ncbi:DUF418 domain-containing protein [Niabella terrae]
MSERSTNKKYRIELIDALRGFALLGILLHHFLTRFNYKPRAFTSQSVMAAADKLLEQFGYHFFYGKTFPIFAFLFGLSFFLQIKGRSDYRTIYFIKRLLLLIGFGCLNAVFFPSGDILLTYALCGLVLLPLMRLPVKWLVVLGVCGLLQPLEWINLVYGSSHGGQPLIQWNTVAIKQQLDLINANGGIVENIRANIVLGQYCSLRWSVESGRLLQTFGLILLGYSCGKSRFYERFIGEQKRFWKYIALPIFALVISILCKFWLQGKTGFTAEQLRVISFNWYCVSVAFLYIMCFSILYDGIFSKLLPSLRFYGRMSLTNYVLQSILAGFAFAPYGLNLAANLPATFVFLLYLVFVMVQIWFSRIWLTRHPYGPLESLWRKWSNG